LLAEIWNAWRFDGLINPVGYMPMLTWQKNSPHFVIDGNAGDVLILYFGSTNIDDIQISEFHFVIELAEHNGRWWLRAEWHEWGDHGQKPEVEGFVSELSRSIEGGKDLDFHKYLDSWSRQDPDFRALVRARL
jgi:hypothetical protein